MTTDHVNLVAPASPVHSTVQTGTGMVDPARKFKCTTTARDYSPKSPIFKP